MEGQRRRSARQTATVDTHEVRLKTINARKTTEKIRSTFPCVPCRERRLREIMAMASATTTMEFQIALTAPVPAIHHDCLVRGRMFTQRRYAAQCRSWELR